MRKLRFRISIAALILYLSIPFVSAQQYLVPGGEIVGLELKNDRVTVAAVDELICGNAQKIKAGDELISINGRNVHAPEDVKKELMKSGGTVEVKLLRGGQVKIFKVNPEITAQGPKLGVYLRQGISGIGTLTWINPVNGDFGALGHGVNDRQGKLLRLTEGNVYTANIISVRKGIPGTPGQLHGMAGDNIGRLEKNTPTGIYGIMEKTEMGTPIPVASCEEISTGDAVIRCTVDRGNPQDYSVEILKIYPDSNREGRNLLLEVKDPSLLKVTGGIVQGMSGSPIIQNGKLIGAVTHVFTNDPTKGYGILIENMLGG